MRTKFMAVAVAAALSLGALAACGGGSGGGDDKGSVYFLNFKPEVAEVWEQIAADYTAETGVEVKVVTAASNTYEQTLTSEIAKSDPPTIFQINGPVGYANWADYTADLTDSDLYAHLIDQSLAITGEDGGVYGIPYVVEGFGIIYNDAIMKQFFATTTAKLPVTQAADIDSFDTLKQVVEAMQADKEALGINGVFSATSLKPGEDWRWQTHLMDVPLYYEFQDDDYDLTQGTPAEIKFSHADQYQNLFDLYLDNSTIEPAQLGSKTVDEAMAEFALGQSAMVQNGNWGWGQVSGVTGNTVKAEDVHFLPLYTGNKADSSQGLCVGTENYVAINAEASEADQQASLDFLYWVFSSDKGKDYVTNSLGFIAPFDTFASGEGPDDPLATEVTTWMGKSGVTSVPWVFTVMPSQQFKNDFGAQLLQYAQDKTSWADLTAAVVASWKTEAAAAG
ncbi:MAG: ABC transporter substrate-binding protein [Propionibacteriaceae bacterium]|jgi:raffinose/stachyose/melibiose transport system substrate-binding protein|nr:ABC transporter substrate-binding protein [Propionibacteriaceae bacterium]